MKNIVIASFILLISCIGCQKNIKDQKEKHQGHRDKIINVKDHISTIKTKILFGKPELYIIDSILIVNDYRPNGNKGIHLYNKNTFKHITSTGIIGRGPGEITRPGFIGINETNRTLWMVDHGKRVIWKFQLDSVLKHEEYKPTKKIKLNERFFIEKFDFVNDSILLGRAWDIVDNNSFKMAMAKRNIYTNRIKRYGYKHPKIEQKGRKKTYFSFDLSSRNNLYVKCYSKIDLMTICDIEGNLKCNIYGPDWNKNKDNRKKYFFDVSIANNKIIAAFLGDDDWKIKKENKTKRPDVNLPTKFLVFNKEGAYQKTIETGHEFTRFCIDKENNRVITFFADREDPLGYFNLNIKMNKTH